MIHWLKTDPHYFQLLWTGEKSYEVRLDDRHYAVGDILILADGIQDARAMRAVVAIVISRLGDNFPGIQTGYVGLELVVFQRLGRHGSEFLDTTLTQHIGKVTPIPEPEGSWMKEGGE